MAKQRSQLTRFRIHFRDIPARGEIGVRHGQLSSLKRSAGQVKVQGQRFTAPKGGAAVLAAAVASAPLQAGAESPLVQVQTDRFAFSFFLRDVSRDFPIYVPAFGVAIAPESDPRGYDEIERAVRGRGLPGKLQQLAAEPEESYAEAARHTRNLVCPTWLGVPRDVRTFELDFEYEGQWDHYVAPRFHDQRVKLPELGDLPVRHNFMIGRGVGVVRDLTRRLEDGCLPILHVRVVDEDVRYDSVAFVSFERSPLTAKTVRGTHYLVADSCHAGTNLTPEQRAVRDKLADAELHCGEETVLYFRCTATNLTPAPRYAFFRSAVAAKAPTWTADPKPVNGVFPSTGRVFAVQKFNGRPMPQEEMAVLLRPGQSCTFEFYIPHEPVSPARAAALRRQDFDFRHEECRRFWLAKLATAAQIRVPEPRIDEMVRAGLLHIDLNTHGREPGGPLGVSVGRFGPIGMESGTILQYLESAGWHDVTRRALEYFFAKQRPDGFIQNYEGFMLETGAVLWAVGQHVRYAPDPAWIRRLKPNILKACEYIWAWHKRNCRPDLRGRGYGLLDGKVADPEDPFRIFLLNGYAYAGLQRAAEVLRRIDPAASRKLARQAGQFRQLLRQAFFESVGRSPVVPLADGTWSPTAGPWAEATGPVCLYADVFNAYTHATFVARDSLIGPIQLVLLEVLDPGEPAADWLMAVHADLLTARNAAFSEPYVDPYLSIHLRRGEVKPFLKGYYNSFSALADRQTYTFWEHLFQGSPHKVAEESWFLLQTRFMLYQERGDTLALLAGVPRAWLEQGKRIELKNAASHFGRLDLCVESNVETGLITADVALRPQGKGQDRQRPPKALLLRLPHPDGRRAVEVTGGAYDPATETVRIQPFTGKASVRMTF